MQDVAEDINWQAAAWNLAYKGRCIRHISGSMCSCSERTLALRQRCNSGSPISSPATVAATMRGESLGVHRTVNCQHESSQNELHVTAENSVHGRC